MFYILLIVDILFIELKNWCRLEI